MKILPERIQPEMSLVPNFTGEIRVELIAFNEAASDVQVIKVFFAPSSRTNWHMHPKGQVLHISEGTGFIQEAGGVPSAVQAGDTIITEPGVWHWHGAGQHEAMSHYAIYEKADVQHGELVGDAEYLSAG